MEWEREKRKNWFNIFPIDFFDIYLNIYIITRIFILGCITVSQKRS